MTPHAFLTVLVSLALFVLVVTAIVRGLSSIAAARRAHYATRHLVGRTYWTPDADVIHVDPLLAGWLSYSRRTIVRTGCLALIGFLAGALLAEAADAAPPTSTAITHANHACGVERAAVKLGLDPEAVKLPTEPYDSTIARMVALPRPGQLPESARACDVECMVWRVEAQVVGYKLEADGDYHIVISDGEGHHMIIEIPDPDCAAGGAWGSEIRAARETFLKLLSDRGFPAPKKGKLHRTSFPVRAAGFGFFDKVHGQDGVAKPSGIELHPVLSIEATGGGS